MKYQAYFHDSIAKSDIQGSADSELTTKDVESIFRMHLATLRSTPLAMISRLMTLHPSMALPLSKTMPSFHLLMETGNI